MNFQRFGILIIAALSTAACTKSPAPSVHEDVQKSVEDNTTAKTLAEWDSSASNPDALFEKWKQDKRPADEVCTELRALSDEKLTLFEEHLKSAADQPLVTPCKDELLQRLKAYWKANTTGAFEIEDFEIESASKVHFHDAAVYRDTSHGYFAVTAELPSKEVALTFDDGPHPEYTDQILKTLEDANVHATFFEMGNSIKANPDKVRAVAAHGHSIGSHSITHRCLAAKKICAHNSGNHGHMLSFEEATAEIRGAHQMIYDILGWVDPFFRFPYGESSPDLKKYLADHGVGEFYWAVDSNDWRAQPPQNVITRVMKQLHSLDHGIILMHDIQHRTAIALPGLLKQLYFDGFSPVQLKTSDPEARTHSQLVKAKQQPSQNPGSGLPIRNPASTQIPEPQS